MVFPTKNTLNSRQTIGGVMKGCKDYFIMRCSAVALVAAAIMLFVVGCTQPPEYPEVVQAMRDAGMRFDYTLLDYQYGSSDAEMIVTGPMIGPKVFSETVPPKSGETYAQYTKVVLQLKDGKWVIVDGTQDKVGWTL
jgi:hypothetical protein